MVALPKIGGGVFGVGFGVGFFFVAAVSRVNRGSYADFIVVCAIPPFFREGGAGFMRSRAGHSIAP